MAIFTTDTTSICGYLRTLTLSLCLSTDLHTRPFFPFHINMTTVCILIIHILTINICGQYIVSLGDLLTIKYTPICVQERGTHTHTHRYIWERDTHTFTHTYAHTHIYIYTHTHTHIYIYIHTTYMERKRVTHNK